MLVERSLLDAVFTGQPGLHLGVDSETSAAVVDAGTDLKAFRIRLWATHLVVNPAVPTVSAELGDLTKALSIFDANWGDPLSFVYTNSLLNPVTIL